MLKFIKHHMTSIDGIEIYPIISLSIFVLFFVGMLWHVLRMDKSYVKDVEQYPINDEK
jgi:cytochrome c oxidase cbb3-type subunit IV